VLQGNLLGAQQPERAKVAAWLAVCTGAAFMTVCGIIIAAARDVLGLMYISDSAVVSAIVSVAPFAALSQLADGIMGTAAGALRGMGRQKELLIYNFIGACLLLLIRHIGLYKCGHCSLLLYCSF
jgi:multidrug resistance protein, MATE family